MESMVRKEGSVKSTPRETGESEVVVSGMEVGVRGPSSGW